MNSYVVIGITGEHYNVQADTWSINHNWGTIRFENCDVAVAVFEMKNIIGVISEKTETGNE